MLLKIAFIGVLIFGLGVIFLPKKEERWTGFYYPLSYKEEKTLREMIQFASKRSGLDSFTSLEDCDKWAFRICQDIVRKPTDPRDVYYCAPGCFKSWKGGVVCNEKKGVISTCGPEGR